DRDDRFVANSTYADSRNLLPTWPEDTATLRYDADADALYVDDSNGDASSTQADSSGPLVSETLDFLPLDLTDEAGQPLSGRYAIEYLTESAPPVVRLLLDRGGKEITIAEASLPETIRGDAVRTGSFDNDRDTYVPDDAYRADVRSSEAEPSVTVTLTGAFTSALRTDGPKLVAAAIGTTVEKPTDAAPAVIRIDGNFDDWRNVPGVDDPRGDSVPYLTYDPDVDLLELKVANDDTHIYLYARVAGRVGHCDPRDGRSYFYAYMDVDRDPQTGFLPSRDDECYYGVTIGDDCEVQFEFVDNRLLKTFYGFCGLGGNENVLEQVATRGKSQYGRFDADGRERADYKVEYIHTGGETRITRDLLAGSSDTIDLAISPDGSEVEIVSSLAGFLQDRSGTPTVGLDQEIDVAAGMECSGEPQWAADSTPPLRGYRLTPTSSSQ
ncbi:MAG: hypothetical protein KDA63_03640, partial [Planctomycetales bacterium]|nr:hypothetical protein [Planctomycetales bacterium]